VDDLEQRIENGHGSALRQTFGGLGDSTERAGIQARAADEGPVDVGLREQSRGVVGFYGAAVENARALCERGGFLREPLADGPVDLVGAVVGRPVDGAALEVDDFTVEDVPIEDIIREVFLTRRG